VGDAEVVPLGTRGRPGRGSGSSKPSAAARTLAGSGTANGRRSVPRPRTAQDPRPGVTRAAQPVPEPVQEPVQEPARLPPAQVREPGPAGGIPVGEWVQSLAAAAVEVFGQDWERRTAELLAFLRRRLTGDYRVDEYGFDAEVTERFLLAAVRPLKERWFRVEVRGAENIPTSGGALVVSNHSGTVPVDGLVTMVSVHDAVGRHLRPLGADLVFRLPLVGEMARKGGATLACNEDAQRMLSGGELVGVWPEGFKGIGKPFSERYKLQRFGRGGFVSAAMRTGVPIVPCSVVGAEEIYPLVGNVPALARLLGLPYLPVTPFFPWLGPLGMVPLPSKWLIEFGEPIRTDSYDEGAADDPMLVFNVTDQVRETIQQTLYSLLVQRGSVFG
jgi:1-acyl-sn-glycerol-3-phosphate acyltransferase